MSSQIKFTPTTTTTTMPEQSTSQAQSTITQSPTSIESTTTTMTNQVTTTTTVNTSPSTTAKVSLSNRFAENGFNLTWFPNINYVDFSFTVEVPSSSLANFWAAFAFSKDKDMVNTFQHNSNTCYAYLDTRSIPLNTVSHARYKICCFFPLKYRFNTLDYLIWFNIKNNFDLIFLYHVLIYED